MQKITSISELQEAIKLLEEKRSAEKELLKAEFDYTREKLKPSNLVKSTFHQLFTGPNLVKTAMTATVGLTAGFITKKYFKGLTGRIIKKVLSRFIF